jgi:hypothetical protein
MRVLPVSPRIFTASRIRSVPSAALLAVYSGASYPQASEAIDQRHVALGTQVVDLIALYLLDDPDQVGAVSQVAVVGLELLIQLVGILVQMDNPRGVDR